MRDHDAMATEVVLLVKTALAPVLERLAAAEQRNTDLHARVDELIGMRDRLVVVETKTAQPLPPPPDVTPVLERLAVAEAQLETLGDLRNCVVQLETKAAVPPPPVPTIPDIGPVLERLTDVRERVSRVEARLTDDGQTKAIAAVSERVAVLETKAPVAGPAGKDGVDGKPGADGVGFEDLDVEFDGDRTLALKFSRGEIQKTFPIQLPFLRYKGIYQAGQSYAPGDTVTWANQLWYCHEATITPPSDGSKLWQLCVRKGRDGKDGKDGPQGPAGRDGKEGPPWRS